MPIGSCLKAFFYLLLSQLLFAESAAQDTVYMRNGGVLIAHVRSTSIHRVKYTRDITGDSVIYRISAGKVSRIAYRDGRSWSYRPAHIQQIERREAQRARPKAEPVRRGYPNSVTLAFPTFMSIGSYPGIAVGVDYERFLDAQGRFSAGMSMNRAWAGTAAHGELRRDEVRANIRSAYLIPGFFYHPFGNRDGYDLAIGATVPVGSVRRQDTRDRYTPANPYIPPTTHTLLAALAELRFSVHSRGHFVFTTSIAGGPIISAGATRGGLLLIGLKLGGRF